jgi:hypothetical protein
VDRASFEIEGSWPPPGYLGRYATKMRHLLLLLVLAVICGCEHNEPPVVDQATMNTSNCLTLDAMDRTGKYTIGKVGNFYSHRSYKSPSGSKREKHQIMFETALPAISGGLEYDSLCIIGLDWEDPNFDADSLVGREIQIPTSYNDELQDHVTNFYYYEHLDFDDVLIKFLAREGNRFRIEVTGTAPDPNGGADGRLKIHVDTIVELEKFDMERIYGIADQEQTEP